MQSNLKKQTELKIAKKMFSEWEQLKLLLTSLITLANILK